MSATTALPPSPVQMAILYLPPPWAYTEEERAAAEVALDHLTRRARHRPNAGLDAASARYAARQLRPWKGWT